jgi:hypothetical protein
MKRTYNMSVWTILYLLTKISLEGFLAFYADDVTRVEPTI